METSTQTPTSELQQILYKLTDISLQIGALRAEINDLKNQRLIHPDIFPPQNPLYNNFRRPPWPPQTYY
jgi:hypothetical protein